MTKLSIIILNYNTKDLTLDCIKSIVKNYPSQIRSKEIELIIVDNASADDSVLVLKKNNNIKLIENNRNYGFSKGCNIGAGKSSGKYILFLNSDTKVQDGGFLKMVEFLENHPSVGILGGKLLNSNGSQQASCGNFYNLFNLTLMLLSGERIGLVRKKPKNIQEIDWVSGGSMMIRKDLFEKLNGFDEKLFMYMEDMELCFRAKKTGYKIYFYPDVKITHEEHGSSNRGFAVVNIYKGLIYFYKKHVRWQYLIVKLLLFLKAIVSFLVGVLINNKYLKNTYGEALRIAI